MSKQINILCATDDAYVPYCGIMLTSLFESNRSSVFHVFVISSDLSEAGRSALSRLGDTYGSTISFVAIDRKLVENFPIKKTDHVSLATYYRLFAPKILPKDIGRILYLDCDMVVDGSIEDMYTSDIEGIALACVLDEDYMSDSKYTRLDLPGPKTYFNAGMLLINLDYWREHNVYERCMACINRMPEKLQLHDQDTLNVVLKNEVRHIALKYNMQTGFLYTRTELDGNIRQELLETMDAPVIIHYTGPGKPWFLHQYHPYLDHFRHYMKISLWKDVRLTRTFKVEYRYWRHMVKFFLHLKKYPFIVKKTHKQ